MHRLGDDLADTGVDQQPEQLEEQPGAETGARLGKIQVQIDAVCWEINFPSVAPVLPPDDSHLLNKPSSLTNINNINVA